VSHPAAYIVWNASRNEGVIFVEDSEDPGPGARRDARQASTGQHGVVGSALAEHFFEAYEDDEDRPIVELSAAQLAALIP